MDGIINIYKEAGYTSHDVVAKLRGILKQKKIGHTGTLDPLATGVLPVLIGRAVKASEYMLTSDKYYRATLKLGITTDTEDITGETLTQSSEIPSEERVMAAISEFVGEIMQTPPMYSALKVGGKKLCDLARQGIEIEREPRRVTIHSITAKRLDDTRYSLDVHCSKGTYIRTLCAGIGASIGCGGVMESLERTRASVFTLEDSYTLSQIEALDESERDALIVPIERIFENYEKVTLPPFFARLARCGVEIYLKKLGLELNAGTAVTLYDESGFFALAEVRDFEAGAAIKPIKQFDV